MIFTDKIVFSGKYTGLHWIWPVIILSLLLTVVLLMLPIGQAQIVIDLNSKVAGTSQVFYGEKGAYSETNSTLKAINPGQNLLRFPLHGLYATVRWDPLFTGSDIEINDIHISYLGSKLISKDVVISPAHNVEYVKSSGNKILISMKDGAIDPQLYIDFSVVKIIGFHVFISLLLSIILSSIIIFCMHCKQKISSLMNSLDSTLNTFIAQIRRDKINFREIGILILIGSVLYTYFLSNFSFSIDDEYAALRHDPSVWVGQGRWFVYLIEKFVFQQPSIPFAPYIILVVSLSVSYTLLLRSHGYSEGWKTYFVYPVFCAFPMWWLISTFHANTVALAIGVFFISLSAYMYFGENCRFISKIHNSLSKNCLIICMLACAIAAYQSLLLMFVCFAFGILLVKSMHENRTDKTLIKSLLKKLLYLLLLVLLALILYVAVNTAAQKIIAGDSGYIGHFINPGIINSLFEVIRSVFKEQIALYTGHANRYGANIGLNGVIICLATLVVLRVSIKKTPIALLLWLGVLISPFALHFVSGGEPLPLRTLIALAYVSWLACMLLLSGKRVSLIIASVIIIGLLQIRIFEITSQYTATATIVQSHDRILAADIYRRIGELSENFDRNAPLKIDFYGSKSVNTVYAAAWSGSMQGSFFSWDNGNIKRMTSFMKVMGYENIIMPSVDERIALTPIFTQMPVWPAAGSVKKVGGVYLVRLSKDPDPTHAEFKD